MPYFSHHSSYGSYRLDLLILGRMRINNFMMQKVPMLIQTHSFATVSESRIYGHGAFLSYRCGQKKLLEVLPEHYNRLLVSLLLELFQNFRSNGRFEKTFISVIHRHTDLFGKSTGRISLFLAKIIVQFITALLRISIYFHRQPTFFLTAQNRQKSMCSNA